MILQLPLTCIEHHVRLRAHQLHLQAVRQHMCPCVVIMMVVFAFVIMVVVVVAVVVLIVVVVVVAIPVVVQQPAWGWHLLWIG